jgi:hypothetical protein
MPPLGQNLKGSLLGVEAILSTAGRAVGGGGSTSVGRPLPNKRTPGANVWTRR